MREGFSTGQVIVVDGGGAGLRPATAGRDPTAASGWQRATSGAWHFSDDALDQP